MQRFAEARTDLRVGLTFQGVETPSQTRYVGYYDKILHVHSHQMPPSVSLRLKSITITAIASTMSRFTFLILFDHFSGGQRQWIGPLLYHWQLRWSVGQIPTGSGQHLGHERLQSQSNEPSIRSTIFSVQNEFNFAHDLIVISDIRLPILRGDVKVMFFSTNKVRIALVSLDRSVQRLCSESAEELR